MVPMKRDASAIRHDIENMLTIAQANLEGMLDGVVEPTHERLENVRDSLVAAIDHLKDLALLTRQM